MPSTQIRRVSYLIRSAPPGQAFNALEVATGAAPDAPEGRGARHAPRPPKCPSESPAACEVFRVRGPKKPQPSFRIDGVGHPLPVTRELYSTAAGVAFARWPRRIRCRSSPGPQFVGKW